VALVVAPQVSVPFNVNVTERPASGPWLSLSVAATTGRVVEVGTRLAAGDHQFATTPSATPPIPCST